jgi:hypothetical protein
MAHIRTQCTYPSVFYILSRDGSMTSISISPSYQLTRQKTSAAYYDSISTNRYMVHFRSYSTRENILQISTMCIDNIIVCEDQKVGTP